MHVGWLSADSQRAHTVSPQPSHSRASTQPLHPNALQRAQSTARLPKAQGAHQLASHLKQDSSASPHSSPSQMKNVQPSQNFTRPHPWQLKMSHPGRSQ